MHTPGATPADAGAVSAALREAVDCPLYVVTAADHQGQPSGCLAGFVTQCSILPVRFLICVSKLNHTFFVAERATAMTLHLLGANQAKLARHFGELSGDVVDKFDGLSWHSGPHGAPVLDDCAAWVAGRIIRRVGVGDHEAMVLAPQAGGSGPMTGTLSVRAVPGLRAGHPPV